jgi:transcriptional regulator with XRE-family HTH domain
MNKPAETIGARIKSLRESSGLTQSNVANYLKVDQSLVSMVEKGKRSLTSDMLDKLAALFSVQVSAFEESDTTANHCLLRSGQAKLTTATWKHSVP